MNYSGFWIRFLAYLIDTLIVFLTSAGLIVAAEFAGDVGPLVAPIAVFALWVLYWPSMHASPRQATYGKALLGLKVVDQAQNRISFLRALARELAKLLSSLTLLIGFLIAGFTKRKQALHDFIAATLVVRTEPARLVAALAVALALFAPLLAATLLGGGLVAGLMGGVAAALTSGPEVAMQVPKPPPAPAAPRPVAQAPKPTAEAPKPAAEAPKPAAPPTPALAVPVSMPVQPVAKAPEPPKSAPASSPVPEIPAPIVVKESPKQESVAKETAPEPEPMKDASQSALIPVAAGRVIESRLRFNDLVTAVLYRDAAAVNDLLAFGKWPDKADSTGMTPLMIAASLGQTEIAEALLKAGADPQRAGPAGVTAISIARERKDAALLGLLQGKR